MFPQTIAILEELREKQQLAGIKSEYVFANPDGIFISVDSQYIQFLQRISKKFGRNLDLEFQIIMPFASTSTLMFSFLPGLAYQTEQKSLDIRKR